MRLQCNVCGAKSGAVETLPPSAKELQMLRFFRSEHDATCGIPTGLSSAVGEETFAKNVGPFGSEKPPPVSVRKPHGHFEYTGPYGEMEEGDTLSCCHCRKHHMVRVGTVQNFGWCARCAAYTCGTPECEPCVPFEARLVNEESGKPRLSPLQPKILVPEGAVLPAYLNHTITTPGGLLLPAPEVNDGPA